MSGDFFDPTLEKQIVVLMHRAMLRKAERPIESCEHCNPTGADIPFDWVLDRVTGADSSVTALHSRRAGEMSELPAGQQ